MKKEEKKLAVLNKKNMLLLIGLFCIVYNPPIVAINTRHIVGVCAMVFLIVNYGSALCVLSRKTIFQLVTYYVAITIYLAMIVISSTNGEFSVVFNMLCVLMEIVSFGIVLLIHFNRHGYNEMHFMDMVICIAVTQSMFTVLSLANSSFQEFLLDRLINIGYADTLVTASQWRMYGYSTGLTFATPIFQGVVAMLAIYRGIERDFRYVIIGFFIAITAVINARTAIVVICVGVLTLILVSKLTLVKKITAIAFILASIPLLSTVILPFLYTVSSENFKWISSGYSEIINFVLRGENIGYFEYVTSPEQYPLPDSPWRILFGEGHQIMGGKGTYGVASDIGYINDLWKGGLLYVVAAYGGLFFMLRRIRKSTNQELHFIALFSLIVIPVITIKGSMIGIHDYYIFLIITYVLVCGIGMGLRESLMGNRN